MAFLENLFTPALALAVFLGSDEKAFVTIKAIF
jgi:hypothetical protein